MLRKGRQSIAFFVHPDDEVMVRCLDGSGKYEEISSIDYLNMRFALTYDKWVQLFNIIFVVKSNEIFTFIFYNFIYIEIIISFKSSYIFWILCSLWYSFDCNVTQVYIVNLCNFILNKKNWIDDFMYILCLHDITYLFINIWCKLPVLFCPVLISFLLMDYFL